MSKNANHKSRGNTGRGKRTNYTDHFPDDTFRRKKKNVGLIAAAIAVILLVVAAGTVFAMQSLDHKDAQAKAENDADASDTQDDSEGNEITYQGQKYEYNRDMKSILFLGVDKKGEIELTDYPGEGGQSDCIILIALNQKENTMQLFQISRNTMTDIDVYNAKGEYMITTKTQLTLQYAYGDGEKKSIWLTKKAVSNLMYGIPIHGAISMNIDGISTVNDMLGGVTITIPEDYTYIDPAFVMGSTIALTGEQAEKYVRYRDTSVTGSNNERMARQTQFVMALMSQLKSSSQSDAELYSKLMTGANPYFATDMNADEIQEMSGYEMKGDIVTLPGEERAGERHDEFYMDDAALQEIIVKTFYKLKDV